MLNINILHLIKNKTIPIKYIIKQKNYYNNKFLYNNIINKHIIEIFNVLNSLSIIYLYIYKYISLKQKILLSTNYIQQIFMLKLITSLTSNYYINNNTIYPGIFLNWIFLKKKLIIYKWLRYFFLTNLIIKNNYKNIFYIYYTLYLLYLKLKLRYHGLKNLNIFPNTFIFIYLDKNKYLEEVLKLNKNIIIISNNNLDNFLFKNIIKININIKNYNILYFILKIITTAIYHGTLS